MLIISGRTHPQKAFTPSYVGELAQTSCALIEKVPHLEAACQGGKHAGLGVRRCGF